LHLEVNKMAIERTKHRVEQKTGQIETVEAMFSRYPNEWIYFEVVEEDEYEHPTKGILITHHPDREKLHEMIMQSKVTYGAVLYTGPIVPEGHEVVPWLIATPSLESNTASSL
jgi:hypothetical protein